MASQPRRLKEVAFPEFSVTVADQGSLSALVPVEAFMVNAGFDFSHVKSVSVKIPQAESYGIPANTLAGPFPEQICQCGHQRGSLSGDQQSFRQCRSGRAGTFDLQRILVFDIEGQHGIWILGKWGKVLSTVCWPKFESIPTTSISA